MNKSHIPYKVGTRSSTLSIKQTEDALDKIARVIPEISFALTPMSSPGDEDHNIDLQNSAPDFFTKYLDLAVADCRLDCALHSAKDMPEEPMKSLDWFWLPWKEDPRDVIVLRKGEILESLAMKPVIGISSERREAYCSEYFPNGTVKSIRGTIEQRLALLDAGEYDLLIIAAAALKRLHLAERITSYIPASKLQPPEGQGYLAITFRESDSRFQRLRTLFIKSVVFVGGGPGSPDLCTTGGIKALKNCDVCLYDALVSPDLLKHLSRNAQPVDVGKRMGKYTVTRDRLDQMLVNFVRQGKRVVRLKGGDPGVFGRLAEEIAALERHNLPYRVVPGVSSLNVATTGTGLLLTRRHISRGFTVMTPRLAEGNSDRIGIKIREKLSLVFFMAVGKTDSIVKQLLAEGRAESESSAMIFGAGTDHQVILEGNLGNISKKVERFSTQLPGLLVIGDIADAAFLYKNSLSALQARKVLITCSDELQEAATNEVLNLGGIPIQHPLIRLSPANNAGSILEQMQNYDWITLTSPSAVRCMMAIFEDLEMDVRIIPRIIVSGAGVTRVLQEYRLKPDAEPEYEFSGRSMIALAKDCIKPGEKVLRLRSRLADTTVGNALQEFGAVVTDCVMYENTSVRYTSLPDCDVIFFASTSAVSSFVENYGVSPMKNLIRIAIGKPTAMALVAHDCPATVVAPQATIPDSMMALAAHCLGRLR